MSGATESMSDLDLLAIGKVVEVRGDEVIAELDLDIVELSRVHDGQVYDIGQLGSILKIYFGRSALFAMVNRLRMKAEFELERLGRTEAKPDERVLEARLIGQGEYIRASAESSDPILRFERGVSTYPLPLQRVYLTPKSELQQIYGSAPADGIFIGNYVGADDEACYLDLNELVGKHTAILGSTGAGKSACVTAVIRGIDACRPSETDAEWNPKIVVLDPHGEYSAAFPNARVLSVEAGNLRLPFWLLNLQDTIELLTGRTEASAAAQANIIKSALAHVRRAAADSGGLEDDWVSVDSPIPYDLADFLSQIQESMPSQESRRGSHNSVLDRLEILRNDGRMAFMMSEPENTSESGGLDCTGALVDVVATLLGGDEGPVIVDLSGIPSEVAGILAGTIARLLFTWRVWQTNEERSRDPILLVCEEAHLYVPHQGSAQFAEAQAAVRRVVREGRKYGLGLMIVSQRPSEIDESVLSQCSSWIVLRIGNDRDRDRVRAALPESMDNLASMLSSLRRQEAVIVGEATTLPARVRIRSLAKSELPSSQDVDFIRGWQTDSRNQVDQERSYKIALRWQTQGRNSES